jgi:hypothetical protein
LFTQMLTKAQVGAGFFKFLGFEQRGESSASNYVKSYVSCSSRN